MRSINTVENKVKSIKINFIMNAILTMSSFIFPLITFPYVSRVLLPEGTGKVSFATSLISYFVMFAQLGIPTYGVRACARVRDNKEALSQTAQELLAINLLMGVLAYAGLFLALAFVPRLQEERLLYLVVSVSILFNCIGMEWLYKALEQYTYIAVRSIIFKFVAVVAMFLLVREKSDYVIYGGISILAASASNLFNFFHCRKYISLKHVGRCQFARHLKPVLVFFAMACATTIYTNLDTVMLGFMATNEDVGYYNAAVRIKNILVSIVASLGTVLLPRASYYIERNMMSEFYRITRKALNFVMLVAVPLMLYFIIFAEEGIMFLSGTAYKGSIIPMQIMMPTLLFIGLSNILGIQMLVPLGKERCVLYSVVAGACVDLFSNILLIGKYAAVGAAISNFFAELTVLVVQVFILRKTVIQGLAQIQYGKIGLGLIAAVCSSIWIKSLVLGSFWALAVSACMFFGAYFAILILTKETLIYELMKQITSKVRLSFVKTKGN